MFDALDFRTRGRNCAHPRIKGRWEQMYYIAERAPEGWRGEHERSVAPEFAGSQERLGAVAGQTDSCRSSTKVDPFVCLATPNRSYLRSSRILTR